MVLFATSNLHKFDEISQIFSQKTTIKLDHLDISLLEIQSASLEEVAIFSLKECVRITGNNSVFVEDTGLFIDCLNGFPGPYSAFIINTIGLNGILTLLNGRRNRKAVFQSCIALKFEDTIEIFSGQVEGQISEQISDVGWGYDPIFIPDCDGKRTYGELGQKKNTISHRYLATIKLIKYLNYKLLEGK
jgi:XTP/dITP diphosphohydrolase